MTPTLLLLEYDRRARRSFGRELTLAGYTVLPAGDSRQAVHLYLTHDVRLLLVSARQRVLDASVAVKLLVAINGHLPVVLMANRATCGDLASARGVRLVVEPPSKLSAVVGAVRRVLQPRSSRNRNRVAADSTAHRRSDKFWRHIKRHSPRKQMRPRSTPEPSTVT